MKQEKILMLIIILSTMVFILDVYSIYLILLSISNMLFNIWLLTRYEKSNKMINLYALIIINIIYYMSEPFFMISLSLTIIYTMILYLDISLPLNVKPKTISIEDVKANDDSKTTKKVIDDIKENKKDDVDLKKTKILRMKKRNIIRSR